MGDGLFEVRARLRGGRIARVLFAVEQGLAVLLHGFIKKSQKTPRKGASDSEKTASQLARKIKI
jgi:phage-related protein